MAVNKPILSEKLHYSATSDTGYGYGGNIGHAHGYSGYGAGGGHESSYSSKGGGKKSVALSALTLLAFLFFLHILQTCLEEQQAENASTTNVVVMAARTDPLKKRKGDVDASDGDYSDSDFAEKKSSTPNWDKDDKRLVVTTRIKTFSKYDQPDHF